MVPACELGMCKQSEFRGVGEMVRKGGFILIEFLAVVVLLIILAIVVPVPGAVLHGMIGLSLAAWKLRRREES